MNTKKLYIYNLICIFLPPTRLFNFKSSLLRWCGAKVGKDVQIFSSAKFMGDFDLEIGDNVFIGHEALIMGPKGSKVTIENNAKVASRAIVVTGSHIFSTKGPNIAGEGVCADIRICDGALVDTASIVVPGKTINRMSHVAAGSVVTHDVPEYARVAGIPARIIKHFKMEG